MPNEQEEILKSNQHQILVTKPSSSPPPSRSQSISSYHRDQALEFFKEHRLFHEEEDNPKELRNKHKRSSSNQSIGGDNPNSWLSSVEFRAKYEHFRENDYVSVVNSSMSSVESGDNNKEISDKCNIKELEEEELPQSSSRHHHHHSQPPPTKTFCFPFNFFKSYSKSVDSIPTSSSERSRPHPLHLVDFESQEISITTPGITTQTSGYFSDFDRRASELLGVDRRRLSSFTSGGGGPGPGEVPQRLLSVPNQQQLQGIRVRAGSSGNSGKLITGRLTIDDYRRHSTPANHPSHNTKPSPFRMSSTLSPKDKNISSCQEVTTTPAKKKSTKRRSSSTDRIFARLFGGGSSNTTHSGLLPEITSSNTPGTSGSSSGQQRKWTQVKQRWDDKLQDGDKLDLIKSQISRSLEDELDSVKPHEPGRVSFRLDPEDQGPEDLKGQGEVLASSSNNSETNEDDDMRPQHFHIPQKTLPSPTSTLPPLVSPSSGDSSNARKEKFKVSVLEGPSKMSPSCIISSKWGCVGGDLKRDVISPVFTKDYERRRQEDHHDLPMRSDPEDQDKMEDILKSPTYVKRTAQMFNAIYSQNGSPSSSSTSPPPSQHNPSYLNVSKTISGYSSSLSSYQKSTNGHGGHTITKTNGSSPYSHRFLLNGSNSNSSKNPNSAARTSSPSTTTTTTTIPIRSPSPEYSPSHEGPSNKSSFIMSRIERLYGGTGVSSSTNGSTIITRRTSNGGVTNASRNNERVIPIEIEDKKKGTDQVDNVNVSKDRETIIRVFRGDEILEKEDDLVSNKNKKEVMLQVEVEPRRKLPFSTSSFSSSNTNQQDEEVPVEREESKSPVKPTSSSPPPKDGAYFLTLMSNTTSRLQKFILEAEKDLEEIEDPQSERAGQLHAAIGKANLLIKKKFKQFEGLCHDNLKGNNDENATGDKPETKNDDLAGFWDMCMIQVEQVVAMFEEDKALSSGSSPSATSSSSPSKSSSSPKKSATKSSVKPSSSLIKTAGESSEAAKARDSARRALLAEKRKQMQQKKGTNGDEEVVIFAPEKE